MTKVRELITDALIELGVIDPTQSLDANMAEHALRVLNRMLDAWSSENLMVFTENRNEYALALGKQTYTLGVGGDFNVARPVQITRLSVLLNTGTLELPIPILLTQEWQRVSIKQLPSSFPTAAWITGDFPLQSIWVWPIPAVACSLVLYTWGQLLAFTSLDDTVQFPKGYADAIVSNLAVRLAATYGKQVSQSTGMLAQVSKSRIRTLNSEAIYIGSDPALTGNSSTIATRTFGLVVDS